MDKKYSEDELNLNSFLLEELTDELEGAETYYHYALRAKHLGDTGIATILLSHAKEELKHYQDLMAVIEKSVPDLKTNPLYPLLYNMEDWAEKIADKIARFK